MVNKLADKAITLPVIIQQFMKNKNLLLPFILLMAINLVVYKSAQTHNVASKLKKIIPSGSKCREIANFPRVSRV
ncbi:MAG: hypothetical protein Tsb006_3010 [Rickettsiaceae bacterium]